ncbi:MAG: 30S ribosomal protein S13 [Alphaproteobacteria bacterium]|nr:MAG: 30S ribosomal protein S13 [Alphaproteobacteria bacterium]
MVFRYALRRIYGIGGHRAKVICDEMNIDDSFRVKDMSDADVVKLREIIEKNGYVTGADLQRIVNNNIKRLQANGSLRGRRHLYGLPVRGQRTKSNAKSARARKRVAV